MVAKAINQFGTVDILVNNAGLLYSTPVDEISEDEWDLVLKVNLKSVFLCSLAVLPVMKAKKSGKIVNMSSSAGRSTSELGGAHYTATGASGGSGGSGGGRQAVQVAMERRWANYRTDQLLDVRDMKVALRALRNLAREGNWELDIDLTIDKTAKNAGDIEIVEQRSRVNRVHLVLLMDAGGSMTPHYEQVNRLFSAAHQVGCFKTFKAYYFHNCVYQYLYKDMEQLDRLTTAQVMEGLSPNHRLIFVGDASMAPFELFSPFGWHESLAGLDWLRRFRSRCRASVWLNPDPRRYWRHPTVSAIGSVFPMYRLTLNGLKEAVKKLRAPI